jgi:hypothetical protein
MHVDEARRDGAAGGVDGAPGGLDGQIAHARDAVAGDAHVGAARGRAGAVDDLTTRDLDVEHGS